MMASRIALCVDEWTRGNPEIIGLDGELLDTQEWLEVFSGGDEARRRIAEPDAFSEVWVVSCDDVDPINLAAAVKSDLPDMRVCLVTSDACGSLLSRAHNARIDEVVEQGVFPSRYAQFKQKMRGDFQQEGPKREGLHESGPASATVLAPQREFESATVLAPAKGFGEAALSAAVTQTIQVQPRTSLVGAHAASRAFVLPVVSGSGGAGKSAVSALGALASYRMGFRTLLLDCDLQFGDVAPMVGVDDPLRIDVAMAHPDQLDRELNRNDRLAVLAAPARLEAAEEVVRDLPQLLEELSAMFEVIVANTGAAWAEQHAALLERSSAALFLVDQRASSVSACKHALELCARCGIATGPFQFALNRCMKGAPLSSVDVSCALQGAAVFELREGGRDVEDCLSGGSASDLLDARNEFAKSVEHVMERLLPGGGNALAVEQVPPEPGRLGFRRRGRHADRKRGRR